MRITAWILLISIMSMVIFMPVALFGGVFESVSDSAANHLDSLDGSNDFTPGEKPNQTMGGKIIDSFDGSGSK